MPTLRHTDWNYGIPNARYHEDELQLKQPNGFPIILMPSTLARARQEAEARAEVVAYTGPYFEIYEDENEEGNVAWVGDEVDAEGEDEYEVGEEEEKLASEEKDGDEAEEYDEYDEHDAGDGTDGEYVYEDENEYQEQASTATPIDDAVARKPLAVVDSLGRTRAATNRLKVQVVEVDQPAGLSGTSHACEEDNATGNKKRKRGVTQASKQPKKTRTRELMPCMRERV